MKISRTIITFEQIKEIFTDNQKFKHLYFWYTTRDFIIYANASAFLIILLVFTDFHIRIGCVAEEWILLVSLFFSLTIFALSLFIHGSAILWMLYINRQRSDHLVYLWLSCYFLSKTSRYRLKVIYLIHLAHETLKVMCLYTVILIILRGGNISYLHSISLIVLLLCILVYEMRLFCFRTAFKEPCDLERFRKLLHLEMASARLSDI
jgi:hypothetical protein